MARLIFGCGYLGKRVARRWLAHGDDVAVVTRSASQAGELERQGYAAIAADVTDPASLQNLPTADTVLYAVGFDRAAGHTIEQVYAGGLQNVLAYLPANVNRFIYISTTGVYGPAGGKWIDEQTPSDPRRAGGKASLAAEQALGAHPLGRRSAILRLAGIYGPDRIPFLKELRAGEPIAAPRNGYLNLIHVDDAADIVIAADKWLAAQSPARQPHVFCVCDGHPVVRGDYYSEVARRIVAPPPRFVEPDPDSPRAARAEANRRVRNDKMIRQLGVQLSYPSYREGLAAALVTETHQS
jgi:nucleoside-diphosphate-sugar epimerase